MRKSTLRWAPTDVWADSQALTLALRKPSPRHCFHQGFHCPDHHNTQWQRLRYIIRGIFTCSLSQVARPSAGAIDRINNSFLASVHRLSAMPAPARLMMMSGVMGDPEIWASSGFHWRKETPSRSGCGFLVRNIRGNYFSIFEPRWLPIKPEPPAIKMFSSQWFNRITNNNDSGLNKNPGRTALPGPKTFYKTKFLTSAGFFCCLQFFCWVDGLYGAIFQGKWNRIHKLWPFFCSFQWFQQITKCFLISNGYFTIGCS